MRSLLFALIGSVLLSSAAAASAWWEDVKIKGDLRYRHELIDTENGETQQRHRVRARLLVEGKVSDQMQAGVQLATGSSDPISTNQTLGDGFSSKSVVIDMAYFTFKPAGAPGLVVQAGKFGNPFFKPGKSELLWDSDLNPEGTVATLTRTSGTVALTAIAAGLWIEERSTSDDSWLGAAQGVARFHMNEMRSSIAAGAGYFGYVNTQGFSPFFDGDQRGNSIDPSGNYASEYKLIEAFAELTHEAGGTPITLLGDFVTNAEADSLDTGWKLGLRLGKAKQPGSWEARYSYREVEMDAVMGTFTDSDFRGGGTDAKGHEIGGGVQLAENTTFNVSYFLNKIGLDKAESDFKRLQVDLQLKF